MSVDSQNSDQKSEFWVESLSQYVGLIGQIAGLWDLHAGNFWFRGVRSFRYDLLPSAVVNGVCDKGDSNDEESLIEEFLVSYQPIHGERVEDPWELYALMQHYGLPTRLLDWSKSSLVSLYFALEAKTESPQVRTLDDAPTKRAVGTDGLQDPDSRVVWVINPYRLNQMTTTRFEVFIPRGAGKMPGEGGPLFDEWLPTCLRKSIDGGAGATEKHASSVIAVEPVLSNKRLLAQQGCFTAFGLDGLNSLKQHYDPQAPAGKSTLLALRIRESDRDKLMESLYHFGISEDAIYQDLNALANRIKRQRLAK